MFPKRSPYRKCFTKILHEFPSSFCNGNVSDKKISPSKKLKIYIAYMPFNNLQCLYHLREKKSPFPPHHHMNTSERIFVENSSAYYCKLKA